MKNIPLTEEAHKRIESVIESGDIAIDATCGNGHDTVFLANTVGVEGIVYGFDIQDSAIEKTKERLEKENLNNVVLIKGCHSVLFDLIDPTIKKSIKAIMFNLGYLPGSDKKIITKKETTLTALNKSLELISNKGLITIIVYPGHEGGKLEDEAVLDWVKKLSKSNYRNEIFFGDENNISSPKLICIYGL